MRTTTTSTLAAAEDTLADEATTNANGAYQLDLSPGTYVVCEADPAELAPVGAGKQRLRRRRRPRRRRPPADGRERHPDRRAELRQLHPRQPAGREVQRPERATATRDPLEGGLEGWTIRAYEDDGDGSLAAAEDTLADEATTNANGAYQLDLSPSTYVVCEATQPNWHQSAPANSACDAVDDLAPGGHPLTVESGTPIDERNFGNYTRGDPPGAKFDDQTRRHPRPARARARGLDDPRL